MLIGQIEDKLATGTTITSPAVNPSNETWSSAHNVANHVGSLLTELGAVDIPPEDSGQMSEHENPPNSLATSLGVASAGSVDDEND